MLYGCCTTMKQYDLIKSKGYDRIVLSATDIFSMDTETFAQTRKTLAEGSVKCRALNDFCSPRLILCGDRYDEDAVISYIHVLASRASQIGVKYIGVGAPKSRSIPQGFSKEMAMMQWKRSLTEMCKACRPFGIVILLEAVCDIECNWITSTNEALDVIESLGIDTLQLVFDTYHAYMMNEDDVPLRRAMKYVRLVHVAQNIDNKRHYLRKENMDEYRIYFDALLENGYNGEVSVEAFYDDMEEQLTNTFNIMKLLCRKQVV